ncbi:winged helix-turn-helix domain-containing protein [Christiangramia echinicola]|uniref:Winged helix DNA-binding domain-containing protein n=1 Tax=Christiangramia echinicola TaxID=279359 RepID=A0A1H1PLS4_9FLAO|nr:transcriptional regulator [Christiangramia echinicola]SDS12093.1 Winged helix DNA-binding domain-containing protein [Christiangramia echinicola]
MKNIISDINKAFDHRIRLGIMSVLMVNDHVDFKTLKELLGATDGNIASHTKTLEKQHYITVEKSFIDRKPNTRYIASDKGRKAFKEHLDALEKLLNAKNDLNI